MDDPYRTADPSTKNLESLDVATATPDYPEKIGRYRIEKVLGEGGFGRVYLAHDDQLHRPVAIKIPRRGHFSQATEAAAYLAEARVLASLDHPNIVPVHDVGTTDDGLCYVVSKVIEGSDLATKVRRSRMSYEESAGLIATVAEALHYAHLQGLVHRDIKPANILIDSSCKAYVADFGLALKEDNSGKEATWAGTPAYMSPEQARGEGHRVDGRSDIFSLGVVFYELLVGRRPFKGDSMRELLEQITSVEARPPRQVDDHIPKDLESICLKCLSKQATQRYTTAKDLAEDLRHFLAAASSKAATVTPAADSVARELEVARIDREWEMERQRLFVPPQLRIGGVFGAIAISVIGIGMVTSLAQLGPLACVPIPFVLFGVGMCIHISVKAGKYAEAETEYRNRRAIALTGTKDTDHEGEALR